MRIGRLEIKWGKKKTWTQLESMINREKGGNAEALKTNPKQQLESYKSWVYSCVSLISDRVSSLPYSFYNKENNQELTTANKGYKIFTKPFIKPNELMTYRFIKSFCQIQLDLCGMACIYKAKNQLGQVWELWPLNMNDFIKVEVTGALFNPTVTYYFRSGNGGWVDYKSDELIVINYPSPINPWEGMSPIQSQAYASDIDTYVEVYERDFFKNSARIDFALTTETALDQTKADELKARWLEKYRGSFHDVAILDSGLKPIPLEYTNKDFEFLNLAGWSKEKILGCFRVPANKLGSTESNRAGSVYTDISFNRESIEPRLILWDEEMTLGVCSTFDSRLEIRHQNPIPRDRQIEVQEAKAYLGGVPTLTINEYRERVHKLGAIDGGDKIIIPNKFIYLDDLEKVTNATTNPPDLGNRDRDDEEPHTNPDGSDDRDDNPTDGRSLLLEDLTNKKQKPALNDFFSLINKTRLLWNEIIYNALKNIQSDNLENHLNVVLVECLSVSVDVLITHYDPKTSVKVDVDDWITIIAKKTSNEYIKTILMNPKWEEENWQDYFKEQFDSNPRLSKIINALLKSCINYSKWILMKHNEMEMEWVVNSNECGHKGRLKEVSTKDAFKIGITKMRFPGEVLSFSCDCTITNKGE